MLKIKKSAFTLAEVLITLAVIGVVAALTIPGLLSSTNDAELKAAWKKNYYEFSQVFAKLRSENKFPYSSTTAFESDLLNNLSYSSFIDDGTNWHAANEWSNPAGVKITQAISKGLILNNGVIIAIWRVSGAVCDKPVAYNEATATCYEFIVDVNGKKPPNVITRDIFAIEAFGDRILPIGAPSTVNTFCNPMDNTPSGALNYGLACSARALYQ